MTKALLSIFFFAITLTSVAQIEKECKKTCTIDKLVYETAYLGVQFGSPCDKESRTDKGVIILKVVEGTAAADTNLQAYDVVLAINGLEINRRGDAIKAVTAFNPFDVVQLTINREGKVLLKDITLGYKTTKIVEEEVCCDDLVGLFDKSNISVYPNPAKNDLNIKFKKALVGNYDLQVFTPNGQFVRSYQTSFKREQLLTTLDVKMLPDGMYVLKITKDNNSYSTLFIVNR